MQSRTVCIAALILLACSTPCVAQTTSPIAAPTPATGNVLSRDKRLALVLPSLAEMSGERRQQVRLGRMLGWITKRTRVQFVADFEGMQEQNRFAAFGACKASELLDAVAALHLTRWDQDTPKSYRLIAPLRESESDGAYLARSEHHRAANTAGLELISKLEKLTDPGIVRDLQSNKLVNASEVPSLIPLLSRYLAAKNQASIHGSLFKAEEAFPLNHLALVKFRVKRKASKGDVSHWWIEVQDREWGSMGGLITNFEEQKKKRPPTFGANIYTPVKFAIRPEKVKDLPQFRRKVRLNLPRATAYDALQALHEQHGINILGDSPESMRTRAYVKIEADTLAEAFDQLTKTFPGAQWEYRPGNFWIFRCPLNPAVSEEN